MSPADTAIPDPADPADQQPLLRVVNPDATPEEIAALVAVFAALGSATPTGAAPAAPPPSEWSARHRGLRRTYPSGPNGWRDSALPR